MRNERTLVLVIIGAFFTFIMLYYNVFFNNRTSLIKEKKENLKHDELVKNKDHVSYQLILENYATEDQLSACKQITQVMYSAIHYYNIYTTASNRTGDYRQVEIIWDFL